MAITCVILAVALFLLAGGCILFAVVVVGVRRGDRTYIGDSAETFVDSITRRVTGVTVSSAQSRRGEAK